MSCSEFLIIHPLLGADDTWSGYLAESTSGKTAPELLNLLYTTAKLNEFDKRHPWLIPALPVQHERNDRTIVIFPTQPATDEVEPLRQYEAELRKASTPLGLRAAPGSKLPGTGTWNYLLISASHARSLPNFALHGMASRTLVVAVDVHSHTDRQWLLDNASTLSTAEFMLTRGTPGAKADTTRIKLLELLTLITSDAETAALEEIFRQESKLAYGLLRLVNSAAMAPRSPITSFAQAINLLGRRQLQRWLQLLVYADPNNGHQANPLLQKAAVRGRLLELLAPHLYPPPEVDNLEDAAFMVGTFSLLTVLLNMSMPEILQQLPLADVVLHALAEHRGKLGELLHAIDDAEARDLDGAGQRLSALGLSGEIYLEAQLEALAWAAKIRSSTQ